LDPAYEYAQGLSSHIRIGGSDRKRHFSKRDQFAAELDNFSRCIIGDCEPEPAGQQGLADVRIIEAMHRSIESGRWINVNPLLLKRPPTLKKNIRRPPVPREPDFVDAKAAAQ
jgi:predicted dehydrogenase